MILTKEQVDQCFDQPSSSGFGKSRYDIAKEIEDMVLRNIPRQKVVSLMDLYLEEELKQ